MDIILAFRPYGRVLSLKWLFLVGNNFFFFSLLAVAGQAYTKPFKFSIECLWSSF